MKAPSIKTLRQEINQTTALMADSLDRLGDTLAKANKYPFDGGIRACQYHLMLKHGWLPREVLSMSVDDLNFALAKERAEILAPSPGSAAARSRN